MDEEQRTIDPQEEGKRIIPSAAEGPLETKLVTALIHQRGDISGHILGAMSPSQP